MDWSPEYSLCRLCGGQAPLRESHIFPKFYWEWLKETGSQYFRDPRRPNLRLQDGVKRRMLCGDCEERFSGVETPFASGLFRPLMANPGAVLPYEGWALRLLISVHWRNLALDLDEGSSPAKWREELVAVEAEWRDWLLDRAALARFGRVHLFVTDSVLPGSPQYNYYLTRVADATPMGTEERLLAYYVKFGKLVSCAATGGLDSEKWVNTLVSTDGGTIDPGSMRILDDGFGRFLIERARSLQRQRQDGWAGMSTRQQQRVLARLHQDRERLANSEMLRALVTDSAWNQSIPRVGRSEQCPCGSGLKYKRCHGR